jgi:hypothetical protein
VRPARSLNVPAHLLFTGPALADPEPAPAGADAAESLPAPPKAPNPRRWRSRTFTGRAADQFLRDLPTAPDDRDGPDPSGDEETT